MRYPWIENEGHGQIREMHSYYGKPEKKPGEIILYSEGRNYWIYDYKSAIKTAKREAWGCADCEGLTPNQKAEKAVLADMQYCRYFLTGERFYVYIDVYRVNVDGEKMGHSEYLSGIEYGYSKQDEDYIKECAEENAQIIYLGYLKEWRKALKECRESRYWNARDILTIGQTKTAYLGV